MAQWNGIYLGHTDLVPLELRHGHFKELRICYSDAAERQILPKELKGQRGKRRLSLVHKA